MDKLLDSRRQKDEPHERLGDISPEKYTFLMKNLEMKYLGYLCSKHKDELVFDCG